MTTENRTTAPVNQLRLILEVEDYDAALTFYRDVLGLTEQAAFEASGQQWLSTASLGSVEESTISAVRNPPRQLTIKELGTGGSWSTEPPVPRLVAHPHFVAL
jgi:catechol 2,3-dioxygenase-like lactoylglutathione lyase family enzyme